MQATCAPRFENVVIAWDGSSRAARAVADAMPILQAASSVRLITVTDDKSEAIDAIRQRRGRSPPRNTASSRPSRAGQDRRQLDRKGARKLGSRTRSMPSSWAHTITPASIETVWGSVTKTVIGEPPCWVVMSH